MLIINDLNKLIYVSFCRRKFIRGKSFIIDDIAFIEVKDLGIIKAFAQENLNHQKGANFIAFIT